MSQLRSVTCHMGSHSVTFHPTQVNAPRLHPSQSGWYSIYRPFKGGGLSKPRPRVQRATSSSNRAQCPCSTSGQLAADAAVLSKGGCRVLRAPRADVPCALTRRQHSVCKMTSWPPSCVMSNRKYDSVNRCVFTP